MEQEKFAQLQADTRRVTEKYQQLFETVASESRSRVDRMDAHAFGILDKTYPREVQERISADSGGALECLTDHAGRVAVDRARQLNQGLHKAQEAVQEFLDLRQRFYRQLESFIWPSSMEPGDYEVPVFCIETRDSTNGNRQMELLLMDRKGQLSAVPNSCLPWVETMVQRQLGGCIRKPLTVAERRKLGDQLEARMNVTHAERRRFESASIEYLSMEGAD
jgi:hypothetical protein